MLLGIVKQFNWLDVFIIITIMRICYVALKSGVPAELFKLLGTIAGVYVGLQYYTQVSDALSRFFPGAKEQAPLEFLDFACFGLLVILSYLIFVLLRKVFYQFVKMEVVSRLNKLGGLVLGIARAYLLTGLIVFALVISTVSYLKESVTGSYLGPRLFRAAPSTYSWLWGNLTSKFTPSEKFNKTVTEIEEGF